MLSKSHSFLCQAINVRGPKEKNPISDKNVLYRRSSYPAPPSFVKDIIIKFTKTLCLSTIQLGKLPIVYFLRYLDSLEMDFPWINMFLLITKKKKKKENRKGISGLSHIKSSCSIVKKIPLTHTRQHNFQDYNRLE